MRPPTARESFESGLAALAEQHHLLAAELFLAAMQHESQKPLCRPDMRYLSYYGLSLTRAGHAMPVGLKACQLAVRKAPHQPLLLLNLGRVYRTGGRTARAIRCFERGLHLAPDDRGLRRELAQLERRARPVVPFLPRTNLLNRWSGKIRASLNR